MSVIAGSTVSLVGCASIGPVTPVAVSDVRSLSGTWEGTVYLPGDERNDIPQVIGDVLASFPAGTVLKASEIANVANGKHETVSAPASVKCPVSNGAVSAALESVGGKLADGQSVSVSWHPVGGKRQFNGNDGPLSATLNAGE